MSVSPPMPRRAAKLMACQEYSGFSASFCQSDDSSRPVMGTLISRLPSANLPRAERSVQVICRAWSPLIFQRLRAIQSSTDQLRTAAAPAKMHRSSDSAARLVRMRYFNDGYISGTASLTRNSASVSIDLMSEPAVSDLLTVAQAIAIIDATPLSPRVVEVPLQ